jgi:iron(III) transport system substrate-binding protein
MISTWDHQYRRHSRKRLRHLAAVVTIGALVAASCGGDDDDPAAVSATADAETSSAPGSAVDPSEEPADTSAPVDATDPPSESAAPNDTTAAAPDPGVALPPGITPEIYQAALDEGVVNYYTAKGESVERSLVEKFNETYPDIEVKILRLGSAELYERLRTELGANIDIVDVLTFADEAIMRRLIEEFPGIMANRTEAGLEPDRENFVDFAFNEDDTYVAVELGVPAFVYNNQLLDPEQAPKTWEDLLKPEFSDLKIAAPINDGGGPGFAMTYLQRKLFGLEYWQSFADQDPVFYGSSAAAMQAVETGEQIVGMAADGTVYSAVQESGGVLSMVIPEGPILPLAFPQGLSTRAPNPNAALLFSAWYTSAEGAEANTVIRGSWTGRTDIAPPEGRGPITESLDDIYAVDPTEYYNPDFVTAWTEEWSQIMGIE